MSNSDGQFIPHVEDDQGEGVKDFYEHGDPVFEKMKELSEVVDITHMLNEQKKQNDDWEERLSKLEADVRAIRQAIGNHILIDGKWTQI